MPVASQLVANRRIRIPSPACCTSVASGGAVLLAGFIILLQAAVYGLSLVVQPWLAALIVGAVVVVVGLAMVQAGKKRLEPSAFTPDRTLHALQKDQEAIRRNA